MRITVSFSLLRPQQAHCWSTYFSLLQSRATRRSWVTLKQLDCFCTAAGKHFALSPSTSNTRRLPPRASDPPAVALQFPPPRSSVHRVPRILLLFFHLSLSPPTQGAAGIQVRSRFVQRAAGSPPKAAAVGQKSC